MKKIFARILALTLVLVMLGGITTTALAGKYSTKVSSIMSTYTLTNSRAKSAPQQQVNGTYRTVELLEQIALKLGCNSSKVSSIMSTYTLTNSRADSAPQQAVNGSYRTVELLELIALKLGCNSSSVSSIMST